MEGVWGRERGGLITPVEFGSGFREALLRPAARAGGILSWL